MLTADPPIFCAGMNLIYLRDASATHRGLKQAVGLLVNLYGEFSGTPGQPKQLSMRRRWWRCWPGSVL